MTGSLPACVVGVAGRLRSGPFALLAMWMIGAAAIAAVILLLDRLDERRQAQVVTAGLSERIELALTLPFRIDPGRESSVSARMALDVDSREFARSVTRLSSLDPGDERIVDLRELATSFYAELGTISGLVAAGELRRAGELALALSGNGGLHAELRELLAVYGADLDREARDARRASEAGSALAVFLALVAFSVALRRATRARRRALALASSNEELLELSRREEQRYRDLFENANEPIALVDLDWVVTDVNEAFASAVGYSRAQLVGSDLAEYFTEEGRAAAEVYRDRKLAGVERVTRYEQTFLAAGGRKVVFEVSTQLIEEEGKPVGILGMCRDVTARKAAEERLLEMVERNKHQATHDLLTGLPNRLAFQREIERAIASSRVRGPFAVALLDIDRFKQVNDTLGHTSGDALLHELAARLRDVVDAPNVVARLGGDEFGVLLRGGADDREGWAEAIARIRAAFEQPHHVDDVPIMIEASIGIAIYPTHGKDVDELLRRADVAMYVAKAAGRGHAVYSAAEDPNDADRLTLLGELRRALAERELVVHYQPIVDPISGRTAKVEALVRWAHPKRGFVPPSEFVPLAETTGLIRPLTQYVLDEAVRQAKEWELQGCPIGVSVNLSTRNLGEADFVAYVLGTLAEHGLDPSRLTLEITESAVMVDPVGTKHLVARLAEHGIDVSIDDFGAGFTSLAHLRDLPIHEIKIDRSFVSRLLTHAHDGAIVRSIVALSHDLHLSVVAEGVEDEEILDALIGLGCDYVQGFHLGRPLAASEVVVRLESEALEDSGERAA